MKFIKVCMDMRFDAKCYYFIDANCYHFITFTVTFDAKW